jgi:phospholipase/lecithinase/hemolysin
MANGNDSRMLLIGAAALALVAMGCNAGRIQAAALPFNNMVVFGDSLSVNGNLLTIATPLLGQAAKPSGPPDAEILGPEIGSGDK